ncbi:MAG: MerR family transcriptional regulator [Microbacteriaceae bacterium]
MGPVPLPKDSASNLSIGQVLAKLSIEFPELSSSKIRFLEDQGLVLPERSAGGYRTYTLPLVERIRVVLSLQRDHFLPLRVIREILADMDAGKAPALPGGQSISVESILSIDVRYTRAELLEKTGASASLLSDAISVKLLAPAELFTEEAVKTMSALVNLYKAGIEPRHLQQLRVQAEKDAAIVHSAVLPYVKSASRVGRQKAVDVARDLASNLEQLRISVVMRAVEDNIG